MNSNESGGEPTTTLHLISHTHWDREWYLPFQVFRLKLVQLVDGLLDMLAADPAYHYFMLDGQTIVLDDYLAVRPEQEAAIAGYVREGRLLIGPWHILPDEFLVGPEATVRNLLQGARTAARFGPSMPVGYIPDPFGHLGQMPQILRGFGLAHAAFRRGLSQEPCEVWWAAPDGSRVLAAYLRDGYDNAAGLPTGEAEHFPAEVIRLADSLATHSAAHHLLLMHGTDHMPPPATTTAALAGAQGRLNGRALVHSTLPAYFAALEAELGPAGLPGLPTVCGELRSPRRHHLLPGVLSARMWIKQRNHQVETLLTRWAEPFGVLGHLVSAASITRATELARTAQVLRAAWRRLMENHPHDSICGCSIDQVHAEMRPRFDEAEQIAEAVASQGLDRVVAAMNTLPPVGAAGAVGAVIVANPHHRPRTDVVAATLALPAGIESVEVVDEAGQVVPHQGHGLAGRELLNVTLNPRAMRETLATVHGGRAPGLVLRRVTLRRVAETVWVDVLTTDTGEPDLAALEPAERELQALLTNPAVAAYHVRARALPASEATFVARDVPGLGVRTYWLRPRLDEAGEPPASRPLNTPAVVAQMLKRRLGQAAAQRAPAAIRNEWLTVEADATRGTLTLTDQRTGATYSRLNRVVDGGDCGDEYNYCPPERDEVITLRPRAVAATVGPVARSITVEYDWWIPAGLAANRRARSRERVRLKVRTVATLYVGVPRLDFVTTVDNFARDHRLRVHFPAQLRASHAHHDGHFEVVRRPVGGEAAGAEVDDTWVEQPRPEVPQRAFTTVADGRIGLTVANRGLPEVEVLPGTRGSTEIALTLLRCVGYLSRNDFGARRGDAGPSLATPEAQVPGRWTFEYSVLPHAGDWRAAWAEAYGFEAPLRAANAALHGGALPATTSLVAIEPPEFVVSALKPAEDGQGWVLRGYNLTGQPLPVRVRPARHLAVTRAAQATLAERVEAELAIEPDGAVALTAGPHQIVTFRFW